MDMTLRKRKWRRFCQPLEKIDRAREGSRIAIGRTSGGRYLRVIYVPDLSPNSVFVITAYELRGKPLIAYRRRRRKKK
jgi:hypothetical protein